MQDFHFVTKINKASPVLMQACAEGKHYKDAVLILRDNRGEQAREYLKITMSDVLVSSYQTGGSAGDIIAGEPEADIIPVDQISLNFGKIKFEYTPQDDQGRDELPVIGEASKPGRRA